VATPPSFPQTLEAARTGEEWALEALYRRLAPAVLRYLRMQGATEPEDLTSEVFVGMVRNLQTFRGDERGFRAWVFSIAHRRLLDQRRAAGRREEPIDPAAFSGPLSGAMVGDVEAEALGRLGTERAVRALASLTHDQRAVVLLRVLADLSVAEVARLLGKTPGAVKTLQRRALSALAPQIEPEDVS
jgi:RNA polymerase sigma factor (sigma-70 family)